MQHGEMALANRETKTSPKKTCQMKKKRKKLLTPK